MFCHFSRWLSSLCSCYESLRSDLAVVYDPTRCIFFWSGRCTLVRHGILSLKVLSLSMTLLSSTLFFPSNTRFPFTLFVQSCYHSKTCPIPGHRSLFFLHSSLVSFVVLFPSFKLFRSCSQFVIAHNILLAPFWSGEPMWMRHLFFVENLAIALTSFVGLTRFSFVQEVEEDMQL